MFSFKHGVMLMINAQENNVNLRTFSFIATQETSIMKIGLKNNTHMYAFIDQI